MTDLNRRTALGVALGAAAAIPLVSTATATAAPSGHGHHDPGWTPVPDAVPVPLDGLFDNDGIDTADAHDGDFDGSGSAYPGEELPPAGPATIAGVKYAFPSAAAGAKNNIVATGHRRRSARSHPASRPGFGSASAAPSPQAPSAPARSP